MLCRNSGTSKCFDHVRRARFPNKSITWFLQPSDVLKSEASTVFKEMHAESVATGFVAGPWRSETGGGLYPLRLSKILHQFFLAAWSLL